MYKITVKSYFSAAHHLRNYKGDCENVHGHNWGVIVTAEYRELKDEGIAIDFRDLKRITDEIIDKLDHEDLNKVEYFIENNPTSENIARYIYDKIKQQEVAIESVVVSETPNYSATYTERN